MNSDPDSVPLPGLSNTTKPQYLNVQNADVLMVSTS